MIGITKTKSSKDILCNYCQLDFANCPKANKIEFGDGKGSDNVTGCSEFTLKSFHHNFPIWQDRTVGYVERVDLDKPSTPTKGEE